MKKIICILLVISTLIILTACNKTETEIQPSKTESSVHEHTYESATCEKPKTCLSCGETTGIKLDHDVSSGKCSMCGIDYYEELKALVIANATGKELTGTVYYETIYDDIIYDKMTLKLCYNERDGVYFYCKYKDADLFESLWFYIDKSSVRNKKYDWNYSVSYSIGEISGTLEAVDFSKNTTSLEYKNSTISSNSAAGEYAIDASSLLQCAITYNLGELLKKSSYDISPYHFGFEHFEN